MSPPWGRASQTASQVRGASLSRSSATQETPRFSRLMDMYLGIVDVGLSNEGTVMRRRGYGACFPAGMDETGAGRRRFPGTGLSGGGESAGVGTYRAGSAITGLNCLRDRKSV